MKKYINIICALVIFLLILFSINANYSIAAEENILEIVSNNTKVSAGEEIEVTVKMNITDISGMSLGILYDNNLQLKEVIEIENNKDTRAFPGTTAFAPGIGEVLDETQSSSEKRGVVANGAISENVSGDYYLVKYKFKVSDNAQIGDKYSIEFYEEECRSKS